MDRAHSGHQTLTRLEENIGAAAIERTAGHLREIESAASQISLEGARYPEHIEPMTVSEARETDVRVSILVHGWEQPTSGSGIARFRAATRV